MGLPRQISNVTFNCFVNNGAINTKFENFPLTINTQAGSFNWNELYYGGSTSDVALSFKQRSRLAGYRLVGDLSWEEQLNYTNYYHVSNAIVQGTTRLFYQSTSGPFGAGSKTVVILGAGTYQNDQFNNMYVTFDGTDQRTITDTFSNGQIVFNSAVSFSGSIVFNIFATQKMVTRVNLSIDGTNFVPIIAKGVGYAPELDGQMTTTPSAITFESEDKFTVIPEEFRK